MLYASKARGVHGKHARADAHRLAIFWEMDSAPRRFWFSMLSRLTYTFWYASVMQVQADTLMSYESRSSGHVMQCMY